MSRTIRDAVQGDLPDIVRILNESIERSTAIFDVQPATVEGRREWFAKYGGENPLIVCETGGRVAGFAGYNIYRPKDGYRTTRETTIYVEEASHGTGVASELYTELIARARRGGLHALIAVLGGKNVASEALHRKFGFELAGHYREIGKKFGKWVDTYTFLKILD